MRLRIKNEYTWNSTTLSWTLIEAIRYVYDGMLIVQERNGGGYPLITYTRGIDLSGTPDGAGGIGGLLARSHGHSTLNGTWSHHHHYHADGNGNITAMVGYNQVLSAAYRYQPFGTTITSSGSMASANLMRFSSKLFHTYTDLYYYGYRFYSPNLQRWLNRDPLGEYPDFNMYRFVSNNPVSTIDPWGLEVSGGEGTGRIIGAVVRSACSVGWGAARAGSWAVRIRLGSPNMDDAREHCVTSCQMAKISGGPRTPRVIGDLREWAFPGPDSDADQKANAAGRNCASSPNDCTACCAAAGF